MFPEPTASQELAARLQRQCSSASALRQSFPLLQRDFSRLDRLDQLYEYLWVNRSIVFERLDTIADFVALAKAVGRLDNALDEFYDRSKSGSLHHLRWDSDFAPGQSRTVSREFAQNLASLKYEDIPLDAERRDLAIKLLCSRIIINQDLISALYAIRTNKLQSFDSWNSTLSESFAVEHLIYDSLGGGLKLELSQFLDYDELKNNAASLDGKPALIVLYHGGFVQALKFSYTMSFPEGFRLQSGRSKSEKQLSTIDKSGALFSALRALKDGQTVLMAPDLWTGASDMSIQVAGQVHKVAKGAPFLAYEAGCQVLWFDLVRTGFQLKPRLIKLIQREPNERYKVFCARFYEAYSAMINAVLCGPPENIVLRRRWAKLIAENSAQEIE